MKTIMTLAIVALMGFGCATTKNVKPSSTTEMDQQAILKKAAEMEDAAKGVTFEPTK